MYSQLVNEACCDESAAPCVAGLPTACGIACADGQCVDGNCCGDDDGEQVCDGECVNTDTDEDNCGGCGMECPCNPLGCLLAGRQTCIDGDCM